LTEIYVLIGLLAAALAGVILIYNQLVQRRQMVNNGWADIDVQLKRRSDLIPRLVDMVTGYAAHERRLFEEVAEKRTRAREAGDDPALRGEAESALSLPVARLFAVAEAYPELKASQHFLELQTELSETETKIEMARRFYNGAARELNTTVQSFPANLVAGMFGFRLQPYFEIQTADRMLPTVDMGAR
jgi:LemA protein